MKKSMLIVAIIAISFVQNIFAQTTNQPINKVLTAYLNIKNALTADDAKTASTSAKTMLDEIAKVQMDKMTSEQNTLWMKYMKKLSYDATHISEVAELDHDREHFTSLSKNMYVVAKAFSGSTPLYYQFCPMANDGKGASWISEKEKISNPYMGKKMPTCGSTKETIQVK
jgi:sensor c-di-GMP phosphodiesterase-like protein